MFTHIMVGTNDVDAAKAFYDAVFAVLGVGEGYRNGDRVFYRHSTGAFGVGKPRNGEAATFANGGTIGFGAASVEQVDAWHAAGLAHGGSCEGGPGPRLMPGRDLYGAYLRDPDGNKLCCFVDRSASQTAGG